jgi:hypothetical protein
MSDISFKVKLAPFKVPTSVQINKLGSGSRQDGFKSTTGSVSLGELDLESLGLLCEKFKEDVFAEAESQRNHARLEWRRDEDPT